MEAWSFIWVMVVLKIPLVALLCLVWYAVKAKPEPVTDDSGDGGVGRRHPREPHGPGSPRQRGPHGDVVVPPPPRTRTTARARERA